MPPAGGGGQLPNAGLANVADDRRYSSCRKQLEGARITVGRSQWLPLSIAPKIESGSHPPGSISYGCGVEESTPKELIPKSLG